MKNYLKKQYKKNRKLRINHSYLVEQFSDYSKIFKEIEKIVKRGDYTLGQEVNEFEKNFANRNRRSSCFSIFGNWSLGSRNQQYTFRRRPSLSSIASMDFRMDEWGIDIAVAGSQKGFMLPAGSKT